MITIKVKVANTLLGKAKGLLGEKKPFALFFTTRWGIHSFGMRFPIAVVVMDDQFQVKAIKPVHLPNRFFVWNPRYKNVLELPLGIVEKEHIHIGTKIAITY